MSAPSTRKPARRRSKTTKRQHFATSPMTAAYAVAEGLAAAAVNEWAISAGGSDARIDHTELVRQALTKAAGYPDPLTDLQGLIKARVADQDAYVELSDGCVAVLVAGTDSGYLYGLALGLALAKVGAR